MRKEDWQQAFGKPPRAFDLKVAHTLDGIGREEKTVRKSWKTGLVIVMGAVMLGGAALAASGGWGVFDFINETMVEVSEPGMTEREKQALVQSPAVNVEGKDVSFSLEGVVFDGRAMNVMFRATPRSDDVLLMSDYCYNVDDNIPTDSESDAPTETFAEKAKREGKRIVAVGAYIDNEEFEGISSGSEHYHEDGTVTLYMRCLFREDVQGAQRIGCTLIEREPGSIKSVRYKESFEVEPNAELERASGAGEYRLDFMTVTGVEVSRSQVGMYVKITGRLDENLTAAQIEEWQNTTIHLYNEQGARLEIISGADWTLDSEENIAGVPAGGETFMRGYAMGAGEALPEALRMVLYNYEEGTEGETVEVPLTDAD